MYLVEQIELNNLENEKLLKFLLAEGIDRTEVEGINLHGIDTSEDTLAFLSKDKARVFLSRTIVPDENAISVFTMEQLDNCRKVLGKDSYVKFTSNEEYPVMVCDQDGQNVIVLAPIAKREET